MSYVKALCEFYFTSEHEVEQEVIVHLPPERVFETTLRVRYVGRAGPSIWTRRTIRQCAGEGQWVVATNETIGIKDSQESE